MPGRSGQRFALAFCSLFFLCFLKQNALEKPPGHYRTAFQKKESILPLASGFRLLLALHAGLFIMFALTNLGQNASTGALALKTLQSAFQRFVLVDMNLRHLFSLPSPSRLKQHRFHGATPFDRRMATVFVLYSFQPGESTAFSVLKNVFTVSPRIRIKIDRSVYLLPFYSNRCASGILDKQEAGGYSIRRS